jgi:hypothetical protein
MIGTNADTEPPPAPKLEVTSPPPVVPTNPVSAQAKITTTQTNAVALPTEDSGFGSGGELAIGGAFLVVAGGLAIFMLRRSRKNVHASLITQALKKN